MQLIFKYVSVQYIFLNFSLSEARYGTFSKNHHKKVQISINIYLHILFREINDFDNLSFNIYSYRYVIAENIILGCLSVIASKNFLVDQEFTRPETRGRVTKS